MADSTASAWVSVSPWTGGTPSPRRLSQEEIQEPMRWLHRSLRALFGAVRDKPIEERCIAIGGPSRHDILGIGTFEALRAANMEEADVFYDYLRDPDVVHL